MTVTDPITEAPARTLTLVKESERVSAPTDTRPERRHARRLRAALAERFTLDRPELDINMMGAWLIEVYRRQFGDIVERDGIDGLIRYLSEHNARQAGGR